MFVLVCFAEKLQIFSYLEIRICLFYLLITVFVNKYVHFSSNYL